jgi:hypothetical protein
MEHRDGLAKFLQDIRDCLRPVARMSIKGGPGANGDIAPTAALSRIKLER